VTVIFDNGQSRMILFFSHLDPSTMKLHLASLMAVSDVELVKLKKTSARRRKQ